MEYTMSSIPFELERMTVDLKNRSIIHQTERANYSYRHFSVSGHLLRRHLPPL